MDLFFDMFNKRKSRAMGRRISNKAISLHNLQKKKKENHFKCFMRPIEKCEERREDDNETKVSNNWRTSFDAEEA
jgi:hypothetical protein